ncbi:MAG TPA: crosslink repair DNA glycosylase YcaQ family protein [Actinomycetes bacterium]|nr:crosslink repair DNA glycosylase YcaQ family protein [Actinomycetes bacterium]
MATAGRGAPPRDTLSLAQARRLALAAQGLTGRAPRRATARTVRAALASLGAVQIDSINVVARSHRLVLAARVGALPEALFEQVVYCQRAAFEYWGHAASFLPVETYRLFLPRMRRMAATTRGWWSQIRERHGALYAPVLDRIRAEGPLPASAFREPGARRRGTWWDWAPVKHVLEDLFDQGVLLVADRVRFERRYDLAERVLPAGLDVSEPGPVEAAVALTVRAAGALGVATAADLADYFRLPAEHARPALAEAVGSGLLEPVGVQGWAQPAYVLPGTSVPGSARFPPVLLSPFDSLIWFRQRGERLFGFHYRVEVYTPAARRRFGYYTMPVLAGGRLVGRVDPKLDRATGRLLLRAAHLEPGQGDQALAATAAAAWRLAGQLGAAEVVLDGTGRTGTGTALARALAQPGGAPAGSDGGPSAPARRRRS